MTYINGGINQIGVALSDSWAAVWIVDTPYIHVLRRDFWDEYANEIREANRRGRVFMNEDGDSGAVHGISTNGDLDDNGLPVNHDGDVDQYVATELGVWIQEDGDAYAEAVAEGYSY